MDFPQTAWNTTFYNSARQPTLKFEYRTRLRMKIHFHRSNANRILFRVFWRFCFQQQLWLHTLVRKQCTSNKSLPGGFLSRNASTQGAPKHRRTLNQSSIEPNKTLEFVCVQFDARTLLAPPLEISAIKSSQIYISQKSINSKKETEFKLVELFCIYERHQLESN